MFVEEGEEMQPSNTVILPIVLLDSLDMLRRNGNEKVSYLLLALKNLTDTTDILKESISLYQTCSEYTVLILMGFHNHPYSYS